MRQRGVHAAYRVFDGRVAIGLREGACPKRAIGEQRGRCRIGLYWRLALAMAILEQIDQRELDAFRHQRRMQVAGAQRAVEAAQILRSPEPAHESERRSASCH